ncbi:hypothetical protein B0H21DRAFT_323942 [Amylocystis lapponica]|nr:hypothetical protein B0H21DRAFT_323942 [Amylocystis lapponica]
MERKDTQPFHAIPASARLPPSHRAATAATLRTLYHIPAAPHPYPRLRDTSLDTVAALLPRSIESDTAPPPRAFLEALAAAAHRAATACFCGSVLAGQTSEGDECGDVALWLGDGAFGRGHEAAVLAALALDLGRSMQAVELAPETRLPASARVSSTAPETRVLVGLLAQLTDVYAFTAGPPPGGAGPLVYFLLGHRVESGESPGWGGLVGVCVTS